MNNMLLAMTLLVSYPVTMLFIVQSYYVYERHTNLVTAMFFPAGNNSWEFAKLFFLPCMMMFYIIHLAIGDSFVNFQAVSGFAVVAMSILPNLVYPVLKRIFTITKKNKMTIQMMMTAVILAAGFIVTYFYTISSFNYSEYEIIARIVVLGVMLIHIATTYFSLNPKNN